MMVGGNRNTEDANDGDDAGGAGALIKPIFSATPYGAGLAPAAVLRSNGHGAPRVLLSC
jgi:hypothetical protein